jgi:hypothetical protein
MRLFGFNSFKWPFANSATVIGFCPPSLALSSLTSFFCGAAAFLAAFTVAACMEAATVWSPDLR